MFHVPLSDDSNLIDMQRVPKKVQARHLLDVGLKDLNYEDNGLIYFATGFSLSLTALTLHH